MRTAATALLMASVAIAATAEDRTKQPLLRVTVCTESVADFETAAQSHARASQIFAAIGVRIDWRQGLEGCSGQSILITLSDKTPPNLHAGAMAYAMPYEGAHIRLFYDRVALTGPKLLPHLLAHVLVHEVAHILQGVPRHSDEGLMKARWNQDDYNAMLLQTLNFTTEDIDLIHRGVEVRSARLLATR